MSIRKHSSALALAAIATVALTACAAGGAEDTGGGTAGSTHITFLDAPTAGSVPIWVAMEEGFFEDHGLDVELLPPAASSEAVVPIIVSGSGDMGVIGASTVLQAASQGVTTSGRFAIAVAAAGADDPHRRHLGRALLDRGQRHPQAGVTTGAYDASLLRCAGQTPCLPGERIPAGSSASLILSATRRWM